MASIYEGMTAKNLIESVMMHGFSTKQEDICKAQDIFGRTAVDELVALARDNGRNDADGNPDPDGSWSSGRRGTSSTFYMIASNIWNWEEVTRFWNLHSNPEHKELMELRGKLKDEMKEHSQTKQDLKSQIEKTSEEHNRTLEARAEKLKAEEEAKHLKAEVHDRDMTIMELKAKLYDLMMKEAK